MQESEASHYSGEWGDTDEQVDGSAITMDRSAVRSAAAAPGTPTGSRAALLRMSGTARM
ncbi:hypothetical protein [Paenibacillus sp. 1P07SE]|uniref:hypothetical protein n=1 Tax=Paenibacillus sp. 1P07SE TaxID=3132209 RepID=UPI0039A507CF